MAERNPSYNSYEGLTPKQAITEYLKRQEAPVTPYTIAQKTGKNHSTVKVYCRRLLSANRIFQPYKGYYSDKIGYGVIGVGGFRVHNVVVVGEAPWLVVKVADVVEWFGGVKVWVQFGVQRHKVTVRVCCDGGMEFDTLRFALCRGYDVCFEVTGQPFPADVVVRTFEANRDFDGVRLDGTSCFSRKGFFDVLERLYQKDRGTVRVEAKVAYPMTVSEFEAKFMGLSRGGVTGFNVNQAMFLLVQEQKGLTAAVKFTNERLVQVGELMRGILRRLDRDGKL